MLSKIIITSGIALTLSGCCCLPPGPPAQHVCVPNCACAPVYNIPSSRSGCCQTFYRCYNDLNCPYYYHCVKYNSYYDYLYRGDPYPQTNIVHYSK